MVELPSGLNLLGKRVAENSGNKAMELLYVGGVGGNYNLKPLLNAVSMMEGVKLTFCCRTYDWETVKEDYAPYLGSNVSVVHLDGDELDAAYGKADLFMMPMSTEYVRFAAPYKLFEAIGHGLPIVAAKDTWSVAQADDRIATRQPTEAITDARDTACCGGAEYMDSTLPTDCSRPDKQKELGKDGIHII